MWRILGGLVLLTSIGICRTDADEVPVINMERFGGGGGGLAQSYSQGWEFAVSEEVTVTQLGVFDNDGMGPKHEVPIAIWTHLGKEVVTGVVPPGKLGALVGKCRYAEIAPVTLKPGRYVIGALYEKGSNLLTIGSNGAEFTSVNAIRWLKARRSPAEELEMPKSLAGRFDELPGTFGPNFAIRVEPDRKPQPGSYYYTREVQPQPQLATHVVPEKSDGSHRDVSPTTVTLFATPDGKLTQLLLDGEPLGVGEEGFKNLAERIKKVNPPYQQLRPMLRVAFSDSVKATDVKYAMSTAYWGRSERNVWPNVARGCDLMSLSEARQPQLAKNGNYVDQNRFRDAGEYIEDRWTGLLWQKDGDDSGKLNFYKAADYAAELSLGGVTGWRVPTREECVTIFPATFAPFKDTHYNSKACCPAGEEFPSYWTSEFDGPPERDYAYIYHWYEKGGGNNCFASRNSAYVRCVRGPLQPHEKPAKATEK